MPTPHVTTSIQPARLHGLMAEFDDPDKLLAATKKTYEAGYRNLDAYSPFPIHGLDEAVGFHRTRLPLVVLIAGLTGALFGLALQYIALGIDYPLNVNSRPLFSWPSFVPIIFECTILFSAFTAGISMIVMNGLPKPYHPVFNVPNFERATQDRFFLCVEARDPKFSPQQTRQFLESLGPLNVSEVQE